MDKNNLLVDAKAAGRKTCKRYENAITSCYSTIIVEVCVWDLCQLRKITAKFFDEGDSGRVPSWASTILARVDNVGVNSLVYSLFPFEAKDEVKIGFVQVNDAKPVDFEVAFLLENHHVDDIFPTGEIIVVFDSIVDHVLVNHGYSHLKGRESLTFWFW